MKRWQNYGSLLLEFMAYDFPAGQSTWGSTLNQKSSQNQVKLKDGLQNTSGIRKKHAHSGIWALSQEMPNVNWAGTRVKSRSYLQGHSQMDRNYPGDKVSSQKGCVAGPLSFKGTRTWNLILLFPRGNYFSVYYFCVRLSFVHIERANGSLNQYLNFLANWSRRLLLLSKEPFSESLSPGPKLGWEHNPVILDWNIQGTVPYEKNGINRKKVLMK